MSQTTRRCRSIHARAGGDLWGFDGKTAPTRVATTAAKPLCNGLASR